MASILPGMGFQGVSNAAFEFGLVFAAARRRLGKHFRRNLGAARVTPPQCVLLHALWERDGATTSEIAARLASDPSIVSRMVDVMVREGLLQRVPDPRDRRAVHVEVTTAGKALQAKILPAMRKTMAELLKVYTDAELEMLTRLLRKLAPGGWDPSDDGETAMEPAGARPLSSRRRSHSGRPSGQPAGRGRAGRR